MCWSSKDGPRAKCGKPALKVLLNALSRHLRRNKVERNKPRALPDSWGKLALERPCKPQVKLVSWVFRQSNWRKGARRKARNWVFRRSNSVRLTLKLWHKRVLALSSYPHKRGFKPISWPDSMPTKPVSSGFSKTKWVCKPRCRQGKWAWRERSKTLRHNRQRRNKVLPERKLPANCRRLAASLV
jgi:hypothetical protein